MDEKLAALELAYEEAKSVHAELQKRLDNRRAVGSTREYTRAFRDVAECALAVEDAAQGLEQYRASR